MYLRGRMLIFPFFERIELVHTAIFNFFSHRLDFVSGIEEYFISLFLLNQKISWENAIFAVLWIQCQFNSLDFLCHFVYFLCHKLFFLNKFSCSTIDMQTSTEERSSFYMHFYAFVANIPADAAHFAGLILIGG